MQKKLFIVWSLVISLGISAVCYGAQTIVAQKVEEAPVIDGMGADPVWDKAQGITTHDKVADIDIALKAVYTDKEIFFLVSFPDPDQSRTHKNWIWDKAMEVYKMGNNREDVFVLKWSMESEPVDLSIYVDNSYRADTWFWKACRTDPAGYADDKIQILSNLEIKNSHKIVIESGATVYLIRKGDLGRSAYKVNLPVEYKGDMILRFSQRRPTGSRGDVKAKGVWKDGRWTIEFRRALDTGNGDDVQFDIKKSYQFGVSRYEIAGRKAEEDLTQPLYGCGDVSEELILIFVE